MCYYITRKISQSEHFIHLESGNKYAFLDPEFAIYKGFDHNMCVVERRIDESHQTERVNMQWGFLPPYLKNYEDV